MVERSRRVEAARVIKEGAVREGAVGWQQVERRGTSDGVHGHMAYHGFAACVG